MDRGSARATLTICFYKDLQTGLDIFQRLHRFERVPKSWIFALREAFKKTKTLLEICLNKQKFIPNLQHCVQETAPNYIFEPAFVILHYNAFDSKWHVKSLFWC